MLDGKKVDLRPLDRKYADELRAIRNSLEVIELSGSRDYAPVTDVEHDRWLTDVLASEAGKYNFAVVEKEGGKAVGAIGLNDIDWISRRAALQVRIGPAENWGKGYGTEAVGLLCKYAFSTLDLGRVYLEVAGHNERAIAVYEKLGFKREGVLRRHTFIAGEHRDTVVMGLLSGELRFE